MQATQHDYLPSLLGDGDKGIEIVYGEEKNKCTGPNEPDKEGLLIESPFTSVSTVSMQGLPLFSLSGLISD
jgi:hypothetical protein